MAVIFDDDGNLLRRDQNDDDAPLLAGDRIIAAVGGDEDAVRMVEAAAHLAVERIGPSNLDAVPQKIVEEALIRFVAWMENSLAGLAINEAADITFAVPTQGWERSGAAMVVAPWVVERAGVIG